MHFVFSTVIVLWLHKGTSVVGFRAAPRASREARWEGEGGGGWGCSGWLDPLSSTAPRVLLPDLTSVTSCKLKSCDSGPTRARRNFPWPTLSWQGLGWGEGGGAFFSTIFSVDAFFFFPFSLWGLGRQRLLDLSMWKLISTLWPCPSAGSRGMSNRGSRRSRPQSRTSGWIPQSHSAWCRWWATGRCGECWSPSPSLNNPASAANTKGQMGRRRLVWWSPLR